MKIKYLLMPLLFISLLASCSVTDNSSNPAADFNSAVEHAYSSFKITIETSKDDLKLTSTYDINKKGDSYIVNYSTQKYNTFDLSNDVIPESVISTETGSYEKNDLQYNIANFKFSEKDFDKYSFESGKLTGEIKNGKKYLNASFDCLNFKVSFIYTTVLSEIKMSYLLTDNTNVKVSINNFK